MELLNKTLSAIQEPDATSEEKALERLNSLTKPQGSLGVLEDIVVKLAGIYRTPKVVSGPKVVLVMAGDHGVVEEGVSAALQSVTPEMVLNFLAGGAAINVFARHSGAKVVVTDVGIAAPPINDENLKHCRIRSGTGNIAKGPAMTREEAVEALEVGIRLVNEEIENGAQIIATGEMGIGNTTPSSAILAAFSKRPVEEITGRGTGIDDKCLERKKKAIASAIEINKPDASDGLDVLSKVGGLEIGAMAGVMLGAAARKKPVLVDGFICGAAALIASSLSAMSKKYMIASHLSKEPGHKVMLDLLGLKPFLHMDMRLGEGTGAALTFPIIEAAIKMYNEMATFEEAGVVM
jgi:nicotinate-nucleotide--dimethylbenzimidazole phosphoribosyltransferase